MAYWRGGFGQWSEANIKKAQETDPPKPLLTINLIFRYLNTMSGFQRLNRQDARAFPIGRGSDPMVADLLNLAIKNVDVQTLAPFVYSDLYLNGHISDRSHVRWKIRFNKMWPIIECEALDPRDVYEDPEGDSYDFDPKHLYVNVCTWQWRDQVVKTYADNETEEKYINDRLDSSKTRRDRTFFKTSPYDSKQELVNVIECQYREFKKFTWAFNPERRQVIDKVESFNDVGALVEQGYNVFVDAMPVSYIARISGDLLLENIPHYLPNGWFDVTRYSPYYAMGEDVSMVEQLISQQDELNANRTSMRELIGRAPKGTILYTNQSGLSKTDVADLSLLGGAFEVTDLNQIKVLDTSSYYQALSAFVALYNAAKEEFEGITGVTEVLLGQLKSSTSGVVFNAARQQAAVGLQAGLDNLQRTLKVHYRKLIPILQKFFPTDKLLRLSDDQYPFLENAARAQSPNANPVFAVLSPPDLEIMNEYRETIVKIATDVRMGEFDVVIDFGQQAVTNMQANLQLALQLAQIPGVAPYILDILADMSGFPQKNILIERMRKAMPQLQSDQEQQAAMAQLQGILKMQAQMKKPNGAAEQQPQGLL